MIKLKQAPNSELAELKKTFFYDSLPFDPVAATYWGLSQYDAELPLDTPEGRAEKREFYAGLQNALAGFEGLTLSPRDQTDLVLMQTETRFQLSQLDRITPLTWSNTTTVSDLVDTVYYNVLRQSGRREEWEAILSRMSKIPNWLFHRQENLRYGLQEKAPFYRREVNSDGIEMAPKILRFFESVVLPSIPDAFSSNLRPRFDSALSLIQKALDDYVTFLRDQVIPVSHDDGFVLGKDEYEWRLRHLLFCPLSSDDLFAYGMAQVEKTAHQMAALASDIISHERSSLSLRKVFHELSQNAPKDDASMMRMYRSLIRRTVDFIRDRQLFLLPENYDIELVETPEAFHNVISVAAMSPIPPFADGFSAQFFVTPTRDQDHPKGNPDLLRLNHAHADAPSLVVHEAVPGHDLQLGAAAREFIAGGRSNLSYLVQLRAPWITSALGVEGWAHYVEQLMAEEGFYTPQERLYQLKAAQWRNVRVVVDVGIHTRKMSFNEAVKYLDAHTFSGEQTSEREIYRYSKWPLQALTYHLGKQDLLDLRQWAIDEIGKERFNLALFHREILKSNGVPVSLYRERLLADLKERMRT